MKILISGSSNGIGLEVSKRFLYLGFEVIGLDLLPSKINDEHYTHYVCDIKDLDSLPEINNINYIFNNAGLQNSNDDIDNNLKGNINITEKYAFNNDYLLGVLFNASASSISGQEFPLYVASKAGLVGYMKNVAIRLAPKGVLVNAISLGGVITDSNNIILNDGEAFKKVMDVTPLKKWTSLEECADWVEFLLTKNKSMSGQNILIDNGEMNLNSTFVWPTK